MIKGVFLALGITFGSLLIPLVHIIAFPPAPFLAGYLGIKSAQVPQESYAAKCLLFGVLLGSLFLILASLVVVLAVNLLAFGDRFQTIIWIVVGVLTLYTASMSALGAMFSVLRSGGKSGGRAGEAAEASQE